MSVEGIPAPIRKSLQILATHRALFGVRGKPRASMSEADVARVVDVFEANHAAWALVGAHAIGLLTEPRATADFDFIVESSKVTKIVRDLQMRFGDLGKKDIGAALHLSAIDVDLIRSANHPLFEESLRQVREVGEWKVPRTEALIALKFLAAINPWRDRDKRAIDMIDLRRIYTLEGDRLDRSEILRLGSLAYPGADAELGKLLDKIDRGDPLTI